MSESEEKRTYFSGWNSPLLPSRISKEKNHLLNFLRLWRFFFFFWSPTRFCYDNPQTATLLIYSGDLKGHKGSCRRVHASETRSSRSSAAVPSNPASVGAFRGSNGAPLSPSSAVLWRRAAQRLLEPTAGSHSSLSPERGRRRRRRKVEEEEGGDLRPQERGRHSGRGLRGALVIQKPWILIY